MSTDKEETPEQKRERQTQAIYAAIGRYVEAFEQLVLIIRTACVLITSGNSGQQQRLMNVVFNHRSMSADNLFRIFRSLMAEILKDAPISAEDHDIITSALTQADKEFQDVVSKRNDHLHGTWFVGAGNSASEDWSVPGFIRMKATNQGLDIMPGPRASTDIDALAADCERLNRGW